ncbi:hypothetical protein ACJJTC_004832 [Scirpophaga incertulas]
MSQIRRRVAGAKPYRNYTADTLRAAMAALDTEMSLRESEVNCKVPRATLNRKKTNEKELNKVGRPKVFNDALKEEFVQSIITAAAWGYPLTGLDLSLLVKSYLDRLGLNETRFKGNLPGRDWLKGFLQRHKSTLSVRFSENITPKSRCYPRDIKKILSRIKNYLGGC